MVGDVTGKRIMKTIITLAILFGILAPTHFAVAAMNSRRFS
jgi:hypothetical protein